MRRLLLALMLMASGAWAADGVSFSAGERRLIASFGPWPVAAAPDPSNRVSGMPEAIAFGRALFFETRLSRTGELSCAACHQPERAFTDGRATSIGAVTCFCG